MEQESGNIEQKINDILDKIRPFLQEDGGDVELASYNLDTRILFVRLLGACKDCPISIMTLRAGIERFILNSMPEFRRIEQVRD